MNKIRNNIEKIYLVVMIIILLLATGYDFNILKYKPIIPNMIESWECPELISVIFQIQASVSTLGIAIIALLSEAAKQYIFGISVSNYIMNDRRNILKHKRIIIAELVFIILNYICIVIKLYNTVVVIFLISITLIIFMIYDILVIFHGNMKVKEEIQNKYAMNFKSLHRKECEEKSIFILNKLEEDINFAMETNNIHKIKEDFDFLFEIFETMLINNNFIHYSLILKKWSEVCSNKCGIMLDEKNKEKTIYITDFMYKVYKKCNKYNDKNNKNIYLDIWDNVENQFFKAISNITPETVMENCEFLSLNQELYKNTYVKLDGENQIQKNNNYLSHFSSEFYYNLFQYNYNKNILNEETSLQLKRYLFEKIESMIDYMHFHNSEYIKNNMLYSELSNYTKTLIDNLEEDILKDTFFNSLSDINYYTGNEKHIYNKYFFTIIIYLYYLSEKEQLVSNELKEFAIKLLSSNYNIIEYFFYDYIINTKLDKEFIQNIKYTLRSWEIIPEKEIKYLIMDSTVDIFLLFIVLEVFWSLDDLSENITSIISGQEFSFYNNYVGSQRNNIKIDFKNFLELLYGKKVEENELNEKLDLLETAMANIYRNSELKQSEKQKLSNIDIKNISDKIKKICEKQINEIINVFNNKDNCIDIKCGDFRLLNFKTYVTFLQDNYIKKDIKEAINTGFVRLLVYILREHILIKNIKYNNKKVLIEFFNLMNSIESDLNTIIGYRELFYNYEGEDKFKEFERDKIKIKANGIRNNIVSIDSRKFYISLLDIKVSILKLNRDEILKDLKKNNEDKYLYNIANDSYIPFEEKELLKYIENTKKKVIVECQFEYGFSDENVGIGVFIE